MSSPENLNQLDPSNESNKLTPLEWLLGQWEGDQGTGVYHEEWGKVSEKEFRGKAYLIKNSEITNQEKLKLYTDDTWVYFVADVSHNPDPVSFKMTGMENSKVVFENPQHNFPQKITYEKIGSDSLLAVIEAEIDGILKRIEFSLKKLN